MSQQSQGSVLFINRVYPPDEASTGQILAELAEGLVRQGWQVTVVCSNTTSSTPLYEVHEGVDVWRVRGVPFSRASHLRRALSYLSLYPSLLWRVLRLPAHDVVVTMTDPPLQLLLGLPVRWFKRSRLLHWAQDIYPELAEKLGVIPVGGMLANVLRWCSTSALCRYDRIVVIGRCMRQRFLARGIPDERMVCVNNWADSDLIYPVARQDNLFLQRQRIPVDSQLVVYSGNMGMAHPFESIVQCMRTFDDVMPTVRFLFIGGGPRQAWLQEQIAYHQLQNVCFFPYQDKHELAHSLAAANIHLACMQDDLNGLVVPSKAYGIMAAARPIFYIGPADSEVSRQVQESQCGMVFNEHDATGLSNTLMEWLNDNDLQDTAGQRGRLLAEQQSVDYAARCFSDVMMRVIASRL